MDNLHDLIARFHRGEAEAEARLTEVFASPTTFEASPWRSQGEESSAYLALKMNGAVMLRTTLQVYKNRLGRKVVWMGACGSKKEVVGEPSHEDGPDRVRKQARVTAEQLGKEALVAKFAQLKEEFEHACALQAARAASTERAALTAEIARLSALVNEAQRKLTLVDTAIEASLRGGEAR